LQATRSSTKGAKFHWFLLGTYHCCDELASLLRKNLAKRPQVREVINCHLQPRCRTVLQQSFPHLGPEKRLLTLLGRRMVTNKMRSNVALKAFVHKRTTTEYEAVGTAVIEKDRPVGQKAAEAEVQIIQRPSTKKRERR
jgi:hypothetical protein